jgi:hypothetical protein
MSITATAPIRTRRTALAGHMYTVPVVRELPAQTIDLREDSTW